MAELANIRDKLQLIISKSDKESSCSVNIVARRALSSIDAGYDLDHVLASGGGSNGQGGISVISGLRYLIESINDHKIAHSLMDSLKSLNVSGSTDSHSLHSFECPPTETTARALTKKKRRNKGRNKKKREQAFARAITQEQPDTILIEEEFNISTQSISKDVQQLSNIQKAVSGGQAEDIDRPENLNFLTLNSEQKKQALLNIQSQSLISFSLDSSQEICDHVNDQSCSQTEFRTENKQSIIENDKDWAKLEDKHEKKNHDMNIKTSTDIRTVDIVLKEALHELNGDEVFKPMKNVLKQVIHVLKQGGTLDEMIEMNDERCFSHIKDNEEEIESFFEPPSIVDGKALSVHDALEYLMRSCMVKTAIKIAQVLVELKKPGGNLGSVVVSAKKEKR